MNADSFYHALDVMGQMIKISRLTGTARVPFTVTCKANVAVGGTDLLISGVAQIGDEIRCGAREMDAMGWPRPPRHGDLVEFEDGHRSTVQGHAMPYRLAEDTVYVFRCLGGGG